MTLRGRDKRKAGSKHVQCTALADWMLHGTTLFLDSTLTSSGRPLPSNKHDNTHAYQLKDTRKLRHAFCHRRSNIKQGQYTGKLAGRGREWTCSRDFMSRLAVLAPCKHSSLLRGSAARGRCAEAVRINIPVMSRCVPVSLSALND